MQYLIHGFNQLINTILRNGNKLAKTFPKDFYGLNIMGEAVVKFEPPLWTCKNISAQNNKI